MKSFLRSIVIDPSSSHYLRNKLFDLTDKKLNRDGTLLPFFRLREVLQAQEIPLNTVDFLLNGEVSAQKNDYFSLGVLANFQALAARSDVKLKGFFIMEPPVVVPELYEALPELTNRFEEVYIHNTDGDGYSLVGVDRSKLRKLYWPQPHLGVLDEFWSKPDRLKRVVVINGNHRPKIRDGELYSKRIGAMAELADLGVVDLFGRGWGRWWSRTSLWMPYWLNRNKLMSIYQGECLSKYDVLSKYRYCLCFENMEMTGYVTEKIFDCFYAGTIPLYWGAPNIDLLIPPDSYIDVRKFSSWQEMWQSISSMTDDEFEAIRDAGKVFLNSAEFIKYYDSLLMASGIISNH